MRALRVERADCLVLVEDAGRPGLAHLGVPRSGALDVGALAVANRLVGNPPDAAGLEILLGGLRLRAEQPLRVALAGAALPVAVDGRAAPWGGAVSVPAGSVLEVGRRGGGLRGWLAVAGGVAVSPVLGSRSTDTLSGLGPPPVRAGDVLPVGADPEMAPAADAVPPPPRERPTRLRLAPGPRAGWLTDEAWRLLLARPYAVTTAADRVALRLHGPELVRPVRAELPSEGLVVGAVQVPGDGQPLVFLADHPTTGGYPVVGVVCDEDLPACAQLRPGDSVAFGQPST